MKIINVFVNENSIELKNVDKIIENQVNNAKLIFSFDTSWEEYNKYVIFEDESNNIFKAAILNNEAIIPSGLNNGYISFQIYGYILKDNEIFNRNPSEISIFQLVKSLSPDGVDVKIPTADEWDNYIEQIEEITNKIVSDEANRVKAENLRKESEEKREEFIENVKKSVEKGDFNGTTFIPNVDDDGNISWNNDKGLDNPESTNIKGPKGDDYEITDEDYNSIANIVKDEIIPVLNSNLKESKDYTDNQIINDIKQVEYDESSAAFTFTRHDGTQLVFDLPIEQLLKEGYYDSSVKELVLVLENDQEIRIPASGLIDDYSTDDSDTIQLILSPNNVFKAILKGQSINKTHLSNDLQSEFDSKLDSDSLKDYVKNTNYATASKGGVSKVSDYYGLQIISDGSLAGKTKTYSEYNLSSAPTLISKGTLENVIKGKELVDKPYVDNNLSKVENKVIDTRNELERVKNEIFETGEATDTFIHLEDSAMAEYQELEVDGVCEQESINYFDGDTTIGYIDYDGNIVNAGWLSSNSYVPIEENEDYIITGNNMGNRILYMYYNENKDIINSRLETTAGTIIKSVANAKYLRFSTNNINANNMKVSHTLSPDYPQEIKTIENSLKVTSCNKNILPFNNLEQTTKNGVTYSVEKGVLKLNGTATNGILIDLNNVKVPSGTYYFSSVVTGGTGSYGRYITTKDGTNLKTNSGEITLTENTELHFRFYINSGCVFSNAEVIGQLEKNTQAKTFEQHLETLIEANLPEGEFAGYINDTYRDRFKVEYNEEDGLYHLNLHKSVGRSKNNVIGNIYNSYTNIKYFQFPKPNDYLYYNKNSMDHNLLHTHTSSKGSTGTWDSVNNIGKIVSAASTSNFWLGFEVGTTLEQAQELLQNDVLYYALAEPYVLDLGIVDMPITYNEVTNLFTDSDLLPQINAKYYRNFITTIQNLQVNEKALKQELVDINTRLSALESANTSVTTESEVTE